MAVQLLEQDTKKLKKAEHHWEMHVEKLEGIYRCLTILLDDEFAEFAINGDSRVCKAIHYNVLKAVAENIPGAPIPSERDGERGGASEPPKEENFVTSHHPQMDKFCLLFRPNANDASLYARLEDTVPMELAVDRYLSGEAAMRGASTKDLHSIMAYMQNVQPAPSE